MDIWLTLLIIFIIGMGLLLVGSVVLILLTTGFKKTGRMAGGLYCITAPPGNGKSYIATYLAVEFMKAGRKVFTNYPIVYNDGFKILESRVITKELLLNENLNGSVIIIDEAHRWFWSRDFKKFTEEYKNWFSTLSQHEISLYYIVQHEDRVDTIVNDCANLFGVVQKNEIPILEMPIFFTITWWDRELDMQLSRTRSDIEPYHEERIWFNRDVAQSYDTKFFGTDKREPYDGVFWRAYLKAQYDFEYQGNYDFSAKTRVKVWIYDKVYCPVRNIYQSMTRKRHPYFEMGKTFDRDDQDLEASGGVPSGASGDPNEDLYQEYTDD